MGFLKWLRTCLGTGAGRKKATSATDSVTNVEVTPDTLRTGMKTRDQLVMGVDIGTSLSKVVVLARDRRVAVRFDVPGGGDDPYLLPTAVSVMADGECRLGVHDDASRRYDDIKRPLIEGRTDKNVLLPLIAFKALLFRHVRRQTEESQDRLLGGRLDWLINLGVPTDSYGGGSPGVRDLVGAYHDSATMAWGLLEEMKSKGNIDPVTLGRCRSAMQAQLDRNSDRVGVFPEVVPQVASYVKSKQHRWEGVHVVVDVGSGTLDVTVFQVQPRAVQDEAVPVWARSVQRLGTRYLVDHLAKAFCRDLTWPPFKRVPLEWEIANSLGVSLEELRDVSESFRRKIVCAIGETIREAGRRYNLTWPGRMFLVGGGAFVYLYKEVAKEFERKEWEFCVDLVPLPRPDDLDAPAIDDAHWHRLAVAYGLSFDPFEISDIKPPGDIEPVPRRYWRPPDDRPSWTGR